MPTAADRTWTIRDWNRETQSYDAPRDVTLAQFRAEVEAKKARALEIFRANAAKVEARP